jgi:hypothetical protein
MSDRHPEQSTKLEKSSPIEGKVAVVFGKDVFSKDLYSFYALDPEATLALTIENTMLQNLGDIYKIDASNKAIEEWLRNEKPEIMNDKAYRDRQEASKNIYDALLSVRSGIVSEKEAYEKYVQNKMDKKSFSYMLKQYKNESDLAAFKKELDESQAEAMKEIVSQFKIIFLLEKTHEIICNSKQILAKIKEATTRKLVQYSKLKSNMNNIEKIVQAKKKSYCRIFALEELVRLQRENVIIIAPKLEKAIFQTPTYRQWEFFKKELL